MASGRLGSFLKILTEVALWLAMSVFTLLLSYNTIGVEPTQRGFFCDDQTIRYPYRDDTVSDALAAILFILVPVILMVIVETSHVVSSKEREVGGQAVFTKTLPAKIYGTVGAFLFATMVTAFITETTKLFAGRLRPNFISVCDPDLSRVNCSLGYVIISDDACSSMAMKEKLLDARKSFPSGHASISACGAIYFIIYLQIRFLWRKQIRIILPILQVGVVCAATFVCVSRVTDNKHHFSDVIAGAILGTVVAILTVRYLSCLPKYRTRVSYQLPDFRNDVSVEKISVSNQNSNSTVVEMKNI